MEPPPAVHQQKMSLGKFCETYQVNLQFLLALQPLLWVAGALWEHCGCI